MADWLQAEIITGLQKLYALRLQGTPPEDAIVGTAQVWLEAIYSSRIQWDEALDKQRVRQSFTSLCRQAERWPAPKHFIDNLGSRPQPQALPKPRYPPDQAKANLSKIRQLLNQWTLR